MTLNRYTFPDAYILEELQRAYQVADTKSRIRLLRKLYRGEQRAPFEIALLAVEDPQVEVRQWIARHGNYLDYSRSRPECPNSNLEDYLKNDPDPFVRACLHENPTVFDAWDRTAWLKYFQEATHMERLALMRNPEVVCAHAETLIQKIFDSTNTELGIDLETKKQLIYGLLTNQHFRESSQKLETDDFVDGMSWVSTRAHFSELWLFTSKWPENNNDLRHAVYSYLGVPDDTKSSIYQMCTNDFLRRTILYSCKEKDIQTIKLGMQDADGQCREIAYKTFNPSRYFSTSIANHIFQSLDHGPHGDIQALVSEINQIIPNVLQGEDKSALSGLAQNRSLSVQLLRNVAARLMELDDNIGVWEARQTIREVRKTQPEEENAEENEEGVKEDQSEEDNVFAQRIDILDKKLLSIEKNVVKRLNWLLIGIAVATTIILVVAFK
jgi:hypothetical protein